MSRPAQFNRMPRILEPLPRAEVRIPPPPAASTPPRPVWIQIMLPLVGLFVMVALYGWLRRDWTLALPMAAMSGVSITASILGTLARRRDHRQQVDDSQRAYRDVLDQHREELEHLRTEQVRILLSTDPGPESLLSRSRTHHRRLWERRPADADFLHLRLGLGPLPSTVRVLSPPSAMPGPELDIAEKLVEEYQRVPQVPVRVDLTVGPLGIAGLLTDRTALARALVCSLVAHHSPDEVHLLAVCPSESVAEYSWLSWLPHTHALDPPKARRYLGADDESRRALFEGLLDELYRRQGQMRAAPHSGQGAEWPWLVLLTTDYALVRDEPAVRLLLSPAGRRLSATGVFLVDRASQVPAGCAGLLTFEASGCASYSLSGCDGTSFSICPDQASLDLCEQMARSLAPLLVGTSLAENDLSSTVRLLDLLDVTDVAEHDVGPDWSLRSSTLCLKVPIGLRRGGRPMILDLSQTGHGPHGLVAGTTGSGKSELLQTLVIALALTNHPHDVGFVLVDFKGGGAFSGLAGLPHTQGLVTDLSAGLAARALVALRAEMDRRKRLLNDAGLVDIDRYQDLYRQGRSQAPLPHLFVVIDEFAELVRDYPEFMDGLMEIARTGRSLGLHLILATQSPAGVVKQQIWANARFRICLRVESRQESMDVLQRPEAAELPRIPGRAYLQVGSSDVFDLFQVARVADQYVAPEPASTTRHQSERIVIAEISPLGERQVALDTGVDDDRARADIKTDLEIIVPRLSDMARNMGISKLPNPWPDPLPASVSLPSLLTQAELGGWDGSDWAFAGEPQIDRLPPNLTDRPWLGAVVGLVDDPANQCQEPLLLELAQQDGHVVVVGSPGSGKEIWARTLVTALARTHTPAELHLYLLEFSGQALQPLATLPHVSGLFGPLDDERVYRLFQCLLQSLDERKRACSQAEVDTLVRLRETRPGHPLPAVVVVINGFLGLHTLFPESLRHVTRLAREGGPYGIHLVLVGDRGADIPSSVSSVVERRIALRLSDAEEYYAVLGTRVRASMGGAPCGRGWYGRPPLEFQTAAPGECTADDGQVAALVELASAMDHSWEGSRPSAVESLPALVPLDMISDGSISTTRHPALAVPLGLDDDRLQPVWVHMADDGPDFLLVGTPRAGKTALLKTWVLHLAEANSPEHVQFLLMSGRGNSLHSLADLPHVLEHCAGAEYFCMEGGGMDWLLEEVRHRESLLETVPQLARELSRIVVVLDDYEQVSYWMEGQSEARARLQELARIGSVNVHLLVTGSLPDLGGGLFRDPLLRRVRTGRSGFVVCPLDSSEQNPLGCRVTGSAVARMVPGRGCVVRRGVAQLLQVAWPGDDDEIVAHVDSLRRRWGQLSTRTGE